MVTIKDIAKMAGVSHGTVSNVLNKKGNVSAKKIALVEEVAAKLGYQLNSQAQLLRKGVSDKVYFIQPLYFQEQSNLLQSLLSTYFHRKSIDMESIYLVQGDDIDKVIEQVQLTLPRAIICCAERPSDNFIKNRNTSDIIFFNVWNSKKIEGLTTIGFSHKTTIEKINTIIEEEKVKNIHFITSKYDCDDVFFNSIKKSIPKSCTTDISILNNSKMLYPLFDLLNQSIEDRLIVSTSIEMTNLLKKACSWLNIENKPKLLTICVKQVFHEPNEFYVELDIEKVAKDLAKNIIQQSVSDDYVYETISLDSKVNIPNRNSNNKILKMLTIESPMTQAIKAIVSKYTKYSNVDIQIDTVPYHIMYDLVRNKPNKLKEYDLIRLDMAWLGSIDQELLLPIDNFCQKNDIIDKFNLDFFDAYSFVGNRRYTLPLDSSIQMLFYRKDLFEDKYFQRRYFEITRKQLKLPTKFKQYDRITKFFRHPDIVAEYNLYGHTISNTNSLLSYSDFSPRILEKIPKYDMTTEIFNTTLEEYQKSKKYSLINSGYHWQNVADNFSLGKTAMEIIYSNYAFSFLNSPTILSADMVGVADVPGGHPLLGGGCLGIINQGNSDLSFDFIEWLYSEDVLRVLSSLGGFIMTNDLKNEFYIQNNYPWLEDFEKRIKSGHRLSLGSMKITFEQERELGERIVSRNLFDKEQNISNMLGNLK